MMRVSIGLFLAWLVTGASAGQVGYPQPMGSDDGPRILMMHGARPWRAKEDAELLIRCGARVTNLSSEYLDGHGSSIRRFMTDRDEPEALNGLDPAFARLREHDLLLVHEIPEGQTDAIFTAERVSRLRDWVVSGGHVLLAMTSVPALGDLSPVTGGVLMSSEGRGFASRPAGSAYRSLPKEIPVRGIYRDVRAEEGSETLSSIRTKDGDTLAPFLVRRHVGKGTVTFVNVRIVLPHDIHEFVNWAYGRAFFCAVVSAAMDLPLDVESCVERLEPIPEKVPVGSVRASVRPPDLRMEELPDGPIVKDRHAAFANGIVLDVAEDGSVSVSWPAARVIRRFEVPQIDYSGKAALLSDESSEAVGVRQAAETSSVKWVFRGMGVRENQVVLAYVAEGLQLAWRFKAGTLALDGRKLTGFAEAATVRKCPRLIESVRFSARLVPPEPLFARRFSCYVPPRGYVDVDLSGQTDGDSGAGWTVLGSGQPFELLSCRGAIYAGTPSAAEPTTLRMRRKRGEADIESIRLSKLGRVKAPCTTAFWWHWWSPGEERGHNDYLALYQFVRRHLRQKYGLSEQAAVPVSEYSPELSREAKRTIIEAARQSGYRYVMQPCPESPIEAITAPGRVDEYRLIRSLGLGPRIWTPGGYTQSLQNPICRAHPDWMIRDEGGEVQQYFGNYPVFDIRNPEFYAWYTNILTAAAKEGVSWIYRDMDGGANDNVDYSQGEYPQCSSKLIDYYRFLQSLGMRVGVEGMNPLVLDEYWYRKHLYASFVGREFCLVGSQPGCTGPAGVTLDAFRTGMYGCFPRFDHAGVVFGVDRYPDEVRRGRKADALVRTFNEALDICGMPFIRETPFGTTWTGRNGGALCFWNPTASATIDLPDGWRIRGVEGNVLVNVPAESVYLIDRPSSAAW